MMASERPSLGTLATLLVCVRCCSGALFPPAVFTAPEQDVIITLPDTMPDQVECTVTTNRLENYSFVAEDMDSPPLEDQKVTYWGGPSRENECGVRIKNVSENDTGYWTLMSKDIHGNFTSDGAYVYLARTFYDMPNVENRIILSEELVVDFATELNNNKISYDYCHIMRPDGSFFDDVFTGSCQAVVNKATNQDLGMWTATVGVTNRTEELTFNYTVTGKGWSLNTGVTPTNVSMSEAVHLHCNLEDTRDTLLACKFIRPGDKISFRLTENVGNGEYSYYGNGIEYRECGLTIEHPSALDYGDWQCILMVVHADVNTYIGSFVHVHPPGGVNSGVPVVAVVPSEPLYVQKGTAGAVTCRAEAILHHCSLKSPLGHWLVGSSLHMGLGECRVSIPSFEEKHSGVWLCVMAPADSALDLVSNVTVRVLDKLLVAVKPQMTAQLGGTVVLQCRMTTAGPSIKYCRFNKPDGSGFNVNPKLEPVNGRFEYRGRGLHMGDCGLLINYVSMQDQGRWRCSVRSELQDTEVDDYVTLTVTGSTNVFPNTVEVVRGDDVTLNFRVGNQELSQCEVITPSGDRFDLAKAKSQGLTYWGGGLSEGDCGVRINTNLHSHTSADYRMWTLVARNIRGVEVSDVAWVSVKGNVRLSEGRVMEQHVEYGQKSNVTCNSSGTVFCWLQPPRNSNILLPGSCSHLLDPVTPDHIGNWTCILGLNTSTQEVHDIIELKVRGSGLMVGITKSTAKNLTHLHCNARQPLTFCRFVSPNGTVLVLGDGSVRDRYSYWGQGLAVGHCGVTIANLQDHDRGLWMCAVGDTAGETGDNLGGYIVLYKEEVEHWSSSDEPVHAMYNTSFDLSCRTETVLMYCWFTHPNGSHLSAVPEDRPPGYRYSGPGLEAGHCGITVFRATHDDTGVWRCHMATHSTDGEELMADIDVTVTDIPMVTNVSDRFPALGHNVTLSCQALPKGSHLIYCRYVRPDGTTLVVQPNSDVLAHDRYWYSGSGLATGHCGLLIAGVHQEDYGRWICAVMLQGATEEMDAVLYIREYTDETSGAGLSAGAVTGVVVAVIVVIVVIAILIVLIRKRKRNVNVRSGDVQMDDISVRARAQSTTSSASSSSSQNLSTPGPPSRDAVSSPSTGIMSTV